MTELNGVIAPYGFYVMTREQHDEMMKVAGTDKKFRPLRWLHRANTTGSAVHMMRHYSKYFNNVLVWDIRQNKVGAILSNTYSIQYDPVAPEIMEEYITTKTRPEGTFKTIGRRAYDYPHPSGTYTRTGSVHSEVEGISPTKSAG
jgi:predicted HNH restriction endonuclease